MSGGNGSGAGMKSPFSSSSGGSGSGSGMTSPFGSGSGGAMKSPFAGGGPGKGLFALLRNDTNFTNCFRNVVMVGVMLLNDAISFIEGGN
jgi:hypothetical protein